MPLAKVAVSAAVDETKKKDVLKQLSLAIAGKLGKPEKYVQTIFEADVPMTFAGTFEPAASLEIKSIGGSPAAACCTRSWESPRRESTSCFRTSKRLPGDGTGRPSGDMRNAPTRRSAEVSFNACVPGFIWS